MTSGAEVAASEVGDAPAAGLDLRLLGGLAIYVDGQSVRLRYRKSAALLAYLVGERRSHRRSSLAALLWSDFPESRALANLRSAIADLALHLGPWISVEGDHVAFRGHHGDRIDTEVLSMVAGVDPVLGPVVGDEGQGRRDGSTTYGEAVALAGGEFLAGFTISGAALFEQWVAAEADRYRSLSRSVLGKASLEEAHASRWETAIDLASRAAALDPFDERLSRRVQDLRELSDRELARSSGFRGTTVPIPPTAIIGRSAEIDDVSQRVSKGSRLITITGPGGVGKTRLVLAVSTELARQFAQGVFFVDLSSISRDDLVCSEIAAAFGAPSAFGSDALRSLTATLAPLNLLLILDNCEHLTSVASVVGPLLEGCGQLTVLATSRSPLKLRAEELVPLTGLSSEPGGAGSPAAQLFLERARATGTRLVDGRSELGAIEKLCRVFDGMPLAIELMAARTRATAPNQLLRIVEEGSQSLVDIGGPTATDVPERHHSVRSAISGSYASLSPDTAKLLRAMGVCVDPPDLAMICAVAGSDELPIESIAELVDASLLEPAADNLDRARYRLLETVRAFATEALRASGEEHLVRTRHASYLYGIALIETGIDEIEPAAAAPRGASAGLRSGSRSFHECAGDFAAAVDFAAGSEDPTLLAQLVGSGAMRAFAEIVASRADLVARIQQAVEAGTLEPNLRALAMSGLGYVAGMRRETKSAIAHFDDALECYRGAGNRKGEASALFHMGMARLLNPVDATEVEEARAAMEASLSVARLAGSGRLAAEALSALAMMAITAGNVDDGEALLSEAGREVGDEGSDLYKAMDPLRLGALDLARGRRRESIEKLADAIGVLAENRSFVLTTGYCIALVATNLATDPAGEMLREASRLVGAHAALEHRLGIDGSSAEAELLAPPPTSPVAAAYGALSGRMEADELDEQMKVGSSWSLSEIVDLVKWIALT